LPAWNETPDLIGRESCLRDRVLQDSVHEEANGVSDLSTIDAIGFAAAALVLATFCMRSMSGLRWAAIASNLTFIAYGYLGGLTPVLLLHVLLLPVNSYRLAQLYRGRDARALSRRAAGPNADARIASSEYLHATSRT